MADCEPCDGTGRYGFRDDDDCPHCDGTGHVFTGAYTSYDEDGNPAGHAIEEPCDRCTPPEPQDVDNP